MTPQSNIYTNHLLHSVTNKQDQNVLLRAADLQGAGRMQDALFEYHNLTTESRSLPGPSVYEIRLLFMKGDFRLASSRLKEVVNPKADLKTSPLDALVLLLKCHCEAFTELKLQEAVDVARQVRRIWLEPLQMDGITDTFVLLEYYYQSIINMKSLLQERLVVEGESRQALKQRRCKLYEHLKSWGRLYEAFDVARMEMKFGTANLDQLPLLEDFLKFSDTKLDAGRGDDLTFPQLFYEHRKPLSAAHIQLSIGKVYSKSELPEEALKTLNKTLTLFQDLDSTNGQALTNLQIALLNKATMTDPMGTCQSLRSIANTLIAREDWIGTNSAMSELSEMLQLGPPSLSPQFQECQVEIQRIYERSNNSFSFWHLQSQVWMLEFTKPTSFGKGIEMCEAFFRDAPGCSIRLYREAFATMLQIGYQGIGDEAKSMEYARVCLELTKGVGERGLVIANELVIAGLERKMLKITGSETDIQERIGYLQTLFEEGNGGDDGQRIAEPHVLALLAVYLADLWVTNSDRSGIGETEKEQHLQHALKWVDRGESLLPDVQDDNKASSRAPLSFIRAEILQRMDRIEETITLCSSLLSSEDNALGPQEKADIQYLMAETLSVKCLQDPTTESVEQAKDMYIQAITTTTQLGNVFMAAVCIKALVSMCCIWRRSSVQASISTSEILAWINKWEEIWEEIRSESSVFRGLKGLQVRQRIRERNSTDLYMAAIELCIEEANITEAWKWVQKAKARAVLDSLGLSRVVPAHLLQGLSEESKVLLEQEQALLDEIDTASEGWRYHLRMKHLELRRLMATRSDLGAIQAIRQGGYLELEELEDMFTGQKNVVCVDWMELERGKYHIITVRPGEAPRHFPTNVSTNDVREWLDCYIFGDESIQNLEDALPEDLEALEGLVAPLAEVTTDDDLLVFVPTGLLCSIPLHALTLNHNGKSDCIIERNPVLYSNALAILRQILVRSTTNQPSEPEPRFRTAVFGDPIPEASADSKMVREVGSYLKADMYIGSEATSSTLLSALERYNLVHYQGHAEFHSSSTLQSSVLKLHDQDISMSRLFETSILQSPHVSLVACQSGQQELAVNDEPLGFLTALTIAGAGSVLGTLWELDDIHASSVFTEYFYGDLVREIGMGGRSFVFELAVACQKAVCAMRKRDETKSLYFWAPFILYGSPWLKFGSGSL